LKGPFGAPQTDSRPVCRATFRYDRYVSYLGFPETLGLERVALFP
jgi:hypothetical protein